MAEVTLYVERKSPVFTAIRSAPKLLPGPQWTLNPRVKGTVTLLTPWSFSVLTFEVTGAPTLSTWPELSRGHVRCMEDRLCELRRLTHLHRVGHRKM